MNSRLLFLCILGIALAPGQAQDAIPTQSSQGQPAAQSQPQARWRRMSGEPEGRIGTVTASASDHYSLKTEEGAHFDVYFSANTRILKQVVQQPAANPTACSAAPQSGSQQELKPSGIKVGDEIVARGEIDPAARRIGAVLIVLLDPVCARQARQIIGNLGKNWMLVRVTAIHGKRVTVENALKDATHTTVDDEPRIVVVTDKTTFSKIHQAITLGDIQVGDILRVEGTGKNNLFHAASVTVMVMPRPRGGPVMPVGNPPQ